MTGIKNIIQMIVWGSRAIQIRPLADRMRSNPGSFQSIPSQIFTSIGLLLLVMTFSIGCDRLERETYSNDLGRYVRFNLQIDKDGKQILGGGVNPSAELVSVYEQKSVETLAVPVTITSEPLETPVTVFFDIDTLGTYDAFTIYPEDGVLEFSGTDFTDTIYIDYHSRWEGDGENQILLSLTEVSDTSIRIGQLNEVEKNDKLTVNLAALNLRYYFPAEGNIEILGEEGEEIMLVVYFPDGLFPADLEEIELILNEFSDFTYTIEQQPLDDDATEVVFILTLAEAIDNDLVIYRAVFNLADLGTYTLSGNSRITIIKPEVVPRDNALNTAAMFYNLDDAFYRTYGENWLDYNEDDTCEWSAFNAFTYPVEVSSNHPHAVLYDDKGTADPEDDIYHHAFRIGFNSPNVGNTTNSFNLKRWFNNESNNGEYSSGFNITQALEFFPDGGNSATGGIVKVIEQDLLISTRVEPEVYRSYTISIEGEGEYMEISPGIFEISLELRATNAELFGGTRTSIYRIWNTNDYEDPVDITADCFKPMDL